MPNGAAEDERLGHIFHFNRGLDAGFDANLLECASQCECIYHRSQHPHVVRRGTIHAAIGGRKTAPNVAAADHDCDFHAQIAHVLDAFGDVPDDRWRNVVASATLLHGFATQLEYDSGSMAANEHPNRR